MTSKLQHTVPSLLPGGWLIPTQLLGNADTSHHTSRTQISTRDDSGITLDDPGQCPAGGTTAYIVFDESLSVASSGGNDPLARRHHETALAINHVASACSCGQDRVALVSFDLRSPGSVAPQPFTDSGLRRLRKGLQHLADGNGGSSRLLPTLTHVEQHAGGRGEKAALVVFSDFLLSDRSVPDALNRLCDFPGTVHAVVLGAVPPAVLIANPAVAVTRVTPSSQPGAAARAVFDGLRCHRQF